MSFRVLLVPVLVAALGAPAVAAPKVVTLGGTVRITATKSTIVEVRLPKPVTLDFNNPPKGTSITANGRVAGVMLLDAKKTTAALLLLRFGFCKTAACESPLAYTEYSARGVGRPSQTEQLPAGDYRLAIVTDGAPVTVVLKLPGLKGTTNLKPTQVIHTQHQTLDFGPTGALPLQTLYSASASFDVDGGEAVLLHQFTAATDATLQQQYGFCVYHGPVAAKPAPGCPTGGGLEFSITKVKPEPDRWAIVGHQRYLSEGAYSAGPYYRTVGSAHDPVGSITSVLIPKK